MMLGPESSSLSGGRGCRASWVLATRQPAAGRSAQLADMAAEP